MIFANNFDAPDPTGRQIWLSSRILSLYTWRCILSEFRLRSIYDLSAIELGAGAGLVGLSAAKLGVGRLLLRDGNDSALELLRQNARNKFLEDVVEVQKLEWSEEEFKQKESFDIVLASDCIYCRENLLAFSRTARNLFPTL